MGWSDQMLLAMIAVEIFLIVAGQPPGSPCTIHVDPKNMTHRINPNYTGYHSDAGYAHQARGLYAEMIYGSAFEKVS